MLRLHLLAPIAAAVVQVAEAEQHPLLLEVVTALSTELCTLLMELILLLHLLIIIINYLDLGQQAM
jgi:hypothetical protein